MTDLELSEKLAAVVRGVRDYRSGDAVRKKVALGFLEHPADKSATVLLMALRAVFGEFVLAWEPETIWLSLERDYSVDLAVEARDKIQAAITLIINPAFFWDNLVFQRTTQALNGELYDPEALQECHPAHMNWAVYEARILRGHDPDVVSLESGEQIELDEDVQQYAAVCLQRAGLVYPPGQLLNVADNLQKLLPASSVPFIQEVKKTWEHLDKGALQDRTFAESPLGVQLSRLAACEIYFRDTRQLLAEDVLVLNKTTQI